MDIRAIISGIISGLALICATILAGLDKETLIVSNLVTLAGVCAAYVVGLYSSPIE